MRIVLLLTVGLPVFATQLVALAMPRVEVVRFVPLHRFAEELSAESQDTATAEAPEKAGLAAFASLAAAGEGFVASEMPDDVTARALRFVVLRHRQAV